MSDAIAAIIVVQLAVVSLALARLSYWRRLARTRDAEVVMWSRVADARRREIRHARDERDEAQGAGLERDRLNASLSARNEQLRLDLVGALQRARDLREERDAADEAAESGAADCACLREENEGLRAENARLAAEAARHRADANGMAGLLTDAWKEIGEAGPLPPPGLQPLARRVRSLRAGRDLVEAENARLVVVVRDLRVSRDRLVAENESLKATLARARDALSGG